MPGRAGAKADAACALVLDGSEGASVKFATCCRPIPGDDIIGYVSASRGIIIHRIDCEHVKVRKGGPGERIALVWSPQVQGDFMAEVQLQAINRRGLLAGVAAAITEANSSIENVQMPQGASGEEAVEMRFLVTVRDRVHLAQVLKRVRRLSVVDKVSRS